MTDKNINTPDIFNSDAEYCEYGILGGLRNIFLEAVYHIPLDHNTAHQRKNLIDKWNKEITYINKTFDFNSKGRK